MSYLLDYWFLIPPAVLILLLMVFRSRINPWKPIPTLTEADHIEALAVSVWNNHIASQLVTVKNDLMARANSAVVVAKDAHRLASSQEKSMAYVPKYAPQRQGAVPSAILMLRGFKTYATLAQNFLDIPNEAVKKAYYDATPAIHPLQDYLGISAGWYNSMDYDCLVDGVLLKTCRFDPVSGAVVISGKAVADPVIAWATGDGEPPIPYKPLRHVEGSGADVLAAFLHVATQSAYLKALGLTDEAIAAARA